MAASSYLDSSRLVLEEEAAGAGGRVVGVERHRACVIGERHQPDPVGVVGVG